MSDTLFGRVLTAQITPFTADDKVNYEVLDKLAERQFDAGIDGLVLCATTGESPTLTHEEKLEVFKRISEIAHSYSKKTVANIGNYNTKQSCELAKEAEKTGVDFLMAVVPYYNKPPQEGLYQHFAAIAKSSDLPLILYNIPGRTGINMSADTIIRLSKDFSNIKGLKQAIDNFDETKEIIAKVQEGFEVLSGNDDQTLELMKLGATGVISTCSNVVPHQMRDLVYAAADKEYEQAEKLQEKLSPLMQGLFKTTNPILVKAALEELGFEIGGLRLPLISASKEERSFIAELLKDLDI